MDINGFQLSITNSLTFDGLLYADHSIPANTVYEFSGIAGPNYEFDDIYNNHIWFTVDNDGYFSDPRTARR